MQVESCDLSLVDPDPDQPRREQDVDVNKRLALNIHDLGRLQPAIVYHVGERYLLLEGHRRREAMLLLRREKMAAIVLTEQSVRRSKRSAERIVFRLDEATVTVANERTLDLSELIGVWGRLTVACRKGAREGLDVGTLCRVLADKSRSAV